MEEHRNCPNCAAPYEIGEYRCPYCGTAYFDMSTIDMDTHEAFYLSIKVNGMLITQLVQPEICNISVESEDVCCYGKNGKKIMSFCRSFNVNTDISFHAVAGSNKELITARSIMK